jgi:hypothetical protein
MARGGAAGQLSRAQAPAEKRSRLEDRFTAVRFTPPRWLAQTRRGVDRFSVHRTTRLSNEHRQEMEGAEKEADLRKEYPHLFTEEVED